ncbi:MAG TPA: glycosyltransferase [Blastocatellia bacterium]|nr:glycosyltransferase [Blastocatellia bacterium]
MKTRVVRIIDRLNIGGPAKHVTWLSSGLSGDEFETVLITGVVPPGEGDMGYFAHAAGVEPIVIKEMSRELGPRDVLVIAKLVRMFFRLRPQIIHTHKSKAGAAGRVAATIYKWMTPSALWLRPRDCKIVHTFHGHTFHSYFGALKTRLFIFIERVLARLCTDRIITISDQQRREINETFGVGQAGQFRVIPLGIDFDEVVEKRGLLRRQYGVADDEVLVGIVGRLCEVKNHAMFLNAAAKLISEGVRARFAVIGGGHLQEELEAQASALGIADRVIFTGFREDATALYGELDVVALTSLNEGTPLTLIEGMGAGRAAVSTEVGGVVDLMGERRESRDGFFIWDHGVTAPRGDADTYARAMKFLVGRPELRREMGGRGKNFVRSRLSRQRLVSNMTELYRELLGIEKVQVERNATNLVAATDERG